VDADPADDEPEHGGAAVAVAGPVDREDAQRVTARAQAVDAA
jgi:hypothetical protein